MKRIVFLCLLSLMTSSFAQELQNDDNYTIFVQEFSPLVCSQYTYLITPEGDFYYHIQKGSWLSQTYHTKITEEQYSELFPEEYKRKLQTINANDSIVYGKRCGDCSGIDDSDYEKITIQINGYQLKYTGKCRFSSIFTKLFDYLHQTEPKFSSYTGKITRKSAKNWNQVSEIPEKFSSISF